MLSTYDSFIGCLDLGVGFYFVTHIGRLHRSWMTKSLILMKSTMRIIEGSVLGAHEESKLTPREESNTIPREESNTIPHEESTHFPRTWSAGDSS